MSAGAAFGWVLALALVAAVVWGLVVHDREAARRILSTMRTS